MVHWLHTVAIHLLQRVNQRIAVTVMPLRSLAAEDILNPQPVYRALCRISFDGGIHEFLMGVVDNHRLVGVNIYPQEPSTSHPTHVNRTAHLPYAKSSCI